MSFVERFVLFWSVHYQRFHCIPASSNFTTIPLRIQVLSYNHACKINKKKWSTKWYMYSGNSDNGHSERGQTSLQRSLFLSPNNHLYIANTIWTSEKRITSLQKTMLRSQSVLYSEVPLYLAVCFLPVTNVTLSSCTGNVRVDKSCKAILQAEFKITKNGSYQVHLDKGTTLFFTADIAPCRKCQLMSLRQLDLTNQIASPSSTFRSYDRESPASTPCTVSNS